eukprot:gene9688-8516_t
MMSRADILMLSLSQFFSTRTHIMRLVYLVEPSSAATAWASSTDVSKISSKISLRLIDWFVTNYAKTHNVLKAYSKQQFDPFRRRDRILFHYGSENIETTVGQLNFFRWMIENRILEYVEEHVDEIEADMISSTQHRTCNDDLPSLDISPKRVSCPSPSSQAACTTTTPSKTNLCRMSQAYGRKLRIITRNAEKNDKSVEIAVGIMNDPPGCGKTFVMLALLASEPNSVNL